MKSYLKKELAKARRALTIAKKKRHPKEIIESLEEDVRILEDLVDFEDKTN
jgi:hypothetical protein